MTRHKEYLGDGVYAQIVDGDLLLTTEEKGSPHPTNSIYLDSGVIAALLDYIERVLEREGDEA